jgi:hypothetical protein
MFKVIFITSLAFLSGGATAGTLWKCTNENGLSVYTPQGNPDKCQILVQDEKPSAQRKKIPPPMVENIPIDRCAEFNVLIRQVEREVGPKNTAFSLKTNGVGTSAVFLSKQSNNSSEIRWRVIERQGDKGRWCLIGSGNTLELLMDMHTNKSKNMYGLPGSGHKRCAEGMVDAIYPSSLSVRMWANQELGKSTIFALSDGLSARDFILLASDDDHWVLLSQENNVTCYRSRGESFQTYRDYTTKGSTNQKPDR